MHTRRVFLQSSAIAIGGLSSWRHSLAKPIIDMMAPVPSLAMADSLEADLQTKGYNRPENDFTKRRFYQRQTGGMGFHLHLVVDAKWPIKNELLFRDYLRQDPKVAAEYETLKLHLAEKYPDDRLAYTDGKSEFIRQMIALARQSRSLPPALNWRE